MSALLGDVNLQPGCTEQLSRWTIKLTQFLNTVGRCQPVYVRSTQNVNEPADVKPWPWTHIMVIHLKGKATSSSVRS